MATFPTHVKAEKCKTQADSPGAALAVDERRRPRRVAVISGVVGKVGGARAVGVDHVDFAVAVAARDEGDLAGSAFDLLFRLLRRNPIVLRVLHFPIGQGRGCGYNGIRGSNIHAKGEPRQGMRPLGQGPGRFLRHKLPIAIT